MESLCFYQSQPKQRVCILKDQTFLCYVNCVGKNGLLKAGGDFGTGEE